MLKNINRKIILILIFSLFLSCSTGDNEQKQKTEPPEPQKKTVTVYVTETGTKYHRGSCSYLKRSKISITLENAKSRGYTPCSRCNPPWYEY